MRETGEERDLQLLAVHQRGRQVLEIVASQIHELHMSQKLEHVRERVNGVVRRPEGEGVIA